MATGSLASSSSISTVTGFCVVAEACYGSNGSVSGASESLIGGASGSPDEARVTWDSNPSNGIDSGAVIVNFSAEVGGGSAGVKWSVAGGSPSQITFVHRTYANIQKVLIRAAVQIPAEVHWGGISVKFFRNGRQTEAYSPPTQPEVSTTGASSPVAAEAILTVLPGFTNNTKVTVDGSIRLVCASSITPALEDLFGQIFLCADPCTAV